MWYLINIYFNRFTQQTKTNTCVNGVNPEETALKNAGNHSNTFFFFFFFFTLDWNPYVHQLTCPSLEKSISGS